ncbi:hypothetical protein [Thermogladius calderae]|uniref:hypothetical protein n=1 Tax=Thermogladius calderae TaxID=1200300 RepID=UPI00138A0D4E|nr:hypothetical protein [Thermogladius calderae]
MSVFSPGPVYELSSIVGALVVVLIILSSLLRGPLLRVVVTILGLVVVILHYTVIYLVVTSTGVQLTVLPLLITESTSKGSTLYPDIGQIIVLGILFIWWDEIAGAFKKHEQHSNGGGV